MSDCKPAPPYVYPRQKPTDESWSAGCAGCILIYGRYTDELGFWWRQAFELKSFDVWVPGCDEFFRDWVRHGVGPDLRLKRRLVTERWMTTARRIKVSCCHVFMGRPRMCAKCGCYQDSTQAGDRCPK